MDVLATVPALRVHVGQMMFPGLWYAAFKLAWSSVSLDPPRRGDKGGSVLWCAYSGVIAVDPEVLMVRARRSHHVRRLQGCLPSLASHPILAIRMRPANPGESATSFQFDRLPRYQGDIITMRVCAWSTQS